MSDLIVQCPQCGRTDDLDTFDVIGADDQNIICPDCGREITPNEGEPEQKGK